jgi:hypothetical protein
LQILVSWVEEILYIRQGQGRGKVQGLADAWRSGLGADPS